MNDSQDDNISKLVSNNKKSLNKNTKSVKLQKTEKTVEKRRLKKYTIFVLIGLFIFGGSIFAYSQIQIIDEKIIFDTKTNVNDSILNGFEISEKRITSIALAYEGFYRGSNLVESHEFEEFSSLILSENPIVRDVVIIQNDVVIQSFPNKNLTGSTLFAIDQSFITKNNDDTLMLFLFQIPDLGDMEILLKVDPSKLLYEDSLFSTDYKLIMINLNDENILYSSQSLGEVKTSEVDFTDSDLENVITTTYMSSLIPYGSNQKIDFRILLWTALFEDSDDYYQLSIPFSGAVLAVLVTFLLIRSEKIAFELEEKTISLVKSEKLASIGELSARLAHDLRNPLSVIKNDVEILHTKKILPEHEFERLNRAIGRMSHQIEHVLQFIKSKPLEPIENSILHMINSVLVTLRIPKTITINLPKNDAKVNVDRQQFEVVISNLLLNSIQAIENKGTIDIRINENKNQVITEIQDSGEGISSENIDKIFEPLFTTKQTGTGLGLASCKNIVEKHGGQIEVNTNPTVFSIILPKK